MVNFTKYNLSMIQQPLKSVKIYLESNPAFRITAGLCQTFSTRLLGFMFKNTLDADYGLFFPGTTSSIVNSAIHMFFVNFNLAVFWLDENYSVVDKVLAQRWHPFFAPSKPARHILELHESRLADISIGDRLIISNEK